MTFDDYFAGVYGDRWPILRASLLGEPRRTTLPNPFELAPYQLDEASVAAARALNVNDGDHTLDLCASPGGKTLTTVFDRRGAGTWVANDLSPGRAARLRAVLHDCLPPSVLQNVRVTVGDGARVGLRFADTFDRVLVDAPCSGERHLLSKPAELARWSEKGSKRLTVRQHALLCSGFDSLKSGGRLVYSTCSISPRENDGVIDKLVKSRAGQFRVVDVPHALGAATAHGRLILPDRDGCGPIYFSALEKI